MFRDADAREGGAAMTGLWRVRLVRLCVCGARRSRSEPSDAAAARSCGSCMWMLDAAASQP